MPCSTMPTCGLTRPTWLSPPSARHPTTVRCSCRSSPLDLSSPPQSSAAALSTQRPTAHAGHAASSMHGDAMRCWCCSHASACTCVVLFCYCLQSALVPSSFSFSFACLLLLLCTCPSLSPLFANHLCKFFNNTEKEKYSQQATTLVLCTIMADACAKERGEERRGGGESWLGGGRAERVCSLPLVIGIIACQRAFMCHLWGTTMMEGSHSVAAQGLGCTAQKMP